MPEEKLKLLKKTSINESVKEKDFESIVVSFQQKKPVKWQIPFTLIVFATIFFVLLFTSPTEQRYVSSTEIKPELPVVKAYYSTRKKTEPISNFYSYVHKVDGDRLSGMNELLQKAEWEYIGEIQATKWHKINLVFEDGTSKIFMNYFFNEKGYLYDESTGYAFVQTLDDSSDFFEVKMLEWHLNYSKNKWFYLVVLLPLIIRFIRNSAYKKKQGIQKVPDYRSSFWQGISAALIYGGMLFVTFYTEQVHIGWWYGAIALNIIMFRLLDDRYDMHHKWRIQNDLYSNVAVFLFITLLFYHIV